MAGYSQTWEHLQTYLKRWNPLNTKIHYCFICTSSTSLKLILSAWIWKGTPFCKRLLAAAHKHSGVWPGSTLFSEVLTRAAQTVLNICDFIFLTSTGGHIILYKCDENYTTSFTKFRHSDVCLCMNMFLKPKEFQVSEKDWSIKPAELSEQKL